MNSLAWIGIIIWGLFVTAFGLAGVDSATAHGVTAVQAQDVIFLIAGGMVTCLIGSIGLIGFMGWIPGLRSEQKTYV